MLDAPARRLLAGPLDGAAGVVARTGVTPNTLTAIGWLIGLGACVAAGTSYWTLALVLWLVNRALDGLDGPLARRTGSSELGGFLDIVADFSIYAGFVLAVGIARPEARIACLGLLTAYYLSGTAFLALSSILERLRAQGRESGYADGRSLLFVGGLAEGTETVIAYVVLCLLPQHAAVIAWVFAAMVLVTALQRVGLGVVSLRS